MIFLNTVAGAWGVVLLHITITSITYAHIYIYLYTYYTIYILEIQTPFGEGTYLYHKQIDKAITGGIGLDV